VELTIDTREADGVTLLDVSGILTRGTPSEALLGRVEKLLAAGKKKLILNLSEVTFFDSMAEAGPAARHDFLARAAGDVRR
jgi:anti-sigma B factor antagonist